IAFSGAGSGGSIRLDVGGLSGAGQIEARGGTSARASVGSGGGGRIAIYYMDSSFDNTHTHADGGDNTRPGSAGTIYLRDTDESLGELIVDNGSVSSSLTTAAKTGLNALRSLTVRSSASLALANADVPVLTVEG